MSERSQRIVRNQESPGSLNMRILLLHQNFPGQFRQLAPHLESRGHELVAICSHDRPIMPLRNFKLLRYIEPKKLENLPQGSALWHGAIQRAEAVARLCRDLNQEGWVPDKILAHCGWGESLGLQLIWPTIPQIIWPELWVRPQHLGHGIDPQLRAESLNIDLLQLGQNCLTRSALSMASAWVLPTRYQADSLPHQYRTKHLHVIHEGIDAKNLARPNPKVFFTVRGISLNRQTPIITFVNRNLERLRGFDTFMRSLPQIQRQHPNVRVLIVGDSGGGYGPGHPNGRSWREALLEELHGQLDLDRIHFFGRIPHPELIAMLQASWVHVYLSQPFILGWSLLEAMACGCCVVGSKGMPVEEVIDHNIDGVLLPGTDHDALALQVLTLLNDEPSRTRLGAAARLKALQYDQRITLPMLTQLVES